MAVLFIETSNEFTSVQAGSVKSHVNQTQPHLLKRNKQCFFSFLFSFYSYSSDKGQIQIIKSCKKETTHGTQAEAIGRIPDRVR